MSLNRRFLGGAASCLGALALITLGFACTTEAPPSEENLGQTQDALNSNEQAAYNFFVGKGLKNYQSAGIVGNLIQESNCDPTVAQYGGGPGRGIAQWSVGGRWDTSANDNATWYANKNGQSVWSLNLQLEFIWYELTTFGYGFNSLKSSTDVSGATIAFEDYYEICGNCQQASRINYAQQVLNAWGNTPPPPPPPPPTNVDGYIDSAGVRVVGWAADPNAGNTALKVDLYFGGPAGTGYGVQTTANIARPDVAAALHIGPDHGFDVPTPRYYCDDAVHPVHAYGHDINNNAVELKQSPKDLKCPPTPVGPGILRHVTSPPVLTAWSFDVRELLAWMSTADRNAHNVGTDWPDTLTLGRTSDGAVWVVDGMERRHVINPGSFSAWHFKSTDVKAWTATDAAKYTVGIDLPAAPLLTQEVGNPAVYVLDTEPPPPPPPPTGSTTGAGAGTGSTTGAGAGTGTGAGAGGGSPVGSGAGGGSGASDTPPSSHGCACSVADESSSNDGWLAGALVLGAVLRRRRTV